MLSHCNYAFQYSLPNDGPPLLESQQDCPQLELELLELGAGLYFYLSSEVQCPSGDFPTHLPWRILLAHTCGKKIITNIVFMYDQSYKERIIRTHLLEMIQLREH